MTIRYFYALTILLLLSTACNSDKIKTEKSNKKDISLKLKGGCYNASNDKIIELINLVFDDKGLNGSGRRNYLLYNEGFDLSINGKKNKDGSYDVSITAKSTMQGRENISETTYETWILSEKSLEVTNRNSSHYIGNLNFIKVNCDGATEKDSSLYDLFLGFNEGYAAVVRDGKWGIVNKNWEEVIPCKYYELGNVSEAAVKFYDENAAKYGLLDVKDKSIIVPAQYVHVTDFSEGYAAVLDDAAGKWGIINRKGEMLVKPTYWSVSFFPENPYLTLFNEGLANVAIDDAKWGYIDTNLKNVIPFEFIFAEPFKNGIARVNKNGQDWYFIDKSGKCVKDCK